MRLTELRERQCLRSDGGGRHRECEELSVVSEKFEPKQRSCYCSAVVHRLRDGAGQLRLFDRDRIEEHEEVDDT